MNVCSISLMLGAGDMGGNKVYKVMAIEGISKLWPVNQMQPKACFCQQSFIATEPHRLTYASSIAACMLQWSSGSNRDHMSAKLKLFNLQKKVF